MRYILIFAIFISLESCKKKPDSNGTLGTFKNGKCTYATFEEWSKHLEKTNDQRLTIGQSLEPFYEKDKKDFIEKCKAENHLK